MMALPIQSEAVHVAAQARASRPLSVSAQPGVVSVAGVASASGVVVMMVPLLYRLTVMVRLRLDR